MPSFDFIPPLSAAGASKKSAPADDSNNIQPAEKFQAVMVRVAELFSFAGTPVKTKAGPEVSSDAPTASQNEATAGFSSGGHDGQPAHKILLLPQADELSTSPFQRKKTVEAGKTVAKKADTVHPALAATGLTVAANVLPVVAESASATVPDIAVGTNGLVSTNHPMDLKRISSDIATDDLESGKSAAGQTPATIRQSSLLGKTDAGTESPVKVAQTDLPPAPGTGRISSSAVEEKTLPPGKQLELPETQEQPATNIIKIGAVLEAVPGFGGRHFDNGTAVAQQDTTMKMAAKKTKYSGAEQKLPGSAAVATRDKLPVPQLRVLASAPADESVLPGSAAISADDGAARSFLPEVLDLPRIAPIGPAYVQRTHELVSLQVSRLQDLGADAMRVVIRPDNGLQLSLHLQQRGDTVEVQAFLERGNFGLLNRHWPELQQQLESRGVRVAPLANADLTLGGGSEGFRQPTTSHGQQAGDDADPAEMPVVLISGLPPATATASASRISSRRLETWA
jgi:hypothetical protein